MIKVENAKDACVIKVENPKDGCVIKVEDSNCTSVRNHVQDVYQKYKIISKIYGTSHHTWTQIFKIYLHGPKYSKFTIHRYRIKAEHHCSKSLPLRAARCSRFRLPMTVAPIKEE